MIVKNESHILKYTLNNLINYIKFDYWVICDTGSTDETCFIIESFFKEHNIPGELFHHEWKDFAHNRTLALQCAFNKTDYVLVFDADDSIHGDFVLPPLTADSYMLQFGQGFTYMRPLLFTNRKRWMYRGVLHEYLEAIDTMTNQLSLTGNYYVESGRTGNRSLQPDKYYKDALVLEKAFAEEPPNGLKPRYAFYCAQSYRDAGSYNDKAIEWYKKVLTFEHHWNQEHYFSCLQLGNLYKAKGEMDQSIYYYLRTVEYDSERIEGVVLAMRHFFQLNNHTLVNALYQKFKQYTRSVHHKLFVDLHYYNDRIEYYNSISAFYVNDRQSGYQCCKDIILHKKLDKHEFNNTLQNIFVFYKPHLDSDTDTLSLFYTIDSLQPLSTDLWNYLFQKNREKLTTVTASMLQTIQHNSQQSMIRGHEGLQDKILLTFTTCKRFALFKETIQSILVHWKDIDAITHWLCIDDNSSMEDRQLMQKSYPWIRFYMKSEEEKGHCKSMNIIWDTLNTLQPKYWIHMEDDFLFYRPMEYISPFLPLLNSDSPIKQIVYNRNYAETIDDYDIIGHTDTSFNNIVLHNHCYIDCSYRNCHYWPNYSFRPSICLVETILKVGKFNGSSSFFEKEFAHRWTDTNYKTAFYNSITHRHIGRLTSEFGKVKNAYDLNNESQFGNQPFIKIINLQRRPDRKQKTQHQLQSIIPSWVNATDGLQLDPSPSLKHLFQGNDFGSKRGVIGCALSHYKLWEQLLVEPIHDYYLIMEDDITVCSDFKTKLDHTFNCMNNNPPDILFLGYHMFTHKRNEIKDVYDYVTSESTLHEFQNDLYVGGFFSYIIHKTGAQKIIDYIRIHGINHGIDYLVKIIPGLNIQELRPFIVHSPWYEFSTNPIDTDIQMCNDNLFAEYDQFRFMHQLDQIGNDLSYQKGSLTALLRSALQNDKCAAVNTLGFFKHTIQTLSPSSFFKEKDGIYIKRKTDQRNKKRVKMLCNWCSSEQLCKEWSNMYDPESKFIMTADNTDIDYYVVINSTQEFFEPSKTIVFQMEPWVHASSPWGVKTWGEWAKPDPSLFLEVRGRHSNCHNNVLWQLELSYAQLQSLTYPSKQDRMSTICSSKYFDPGHIARIDFLRFLDKKVDWLDIYNSDNSFDFNHYKGPCTPYIDKSKGILPYKYYFMVENNYEEHFITEKLWEPILCESLCFYYGCPNVTNYIDERAFVLLPINDFEACLQIIQTAIREDWWTHRLPFIQQEKQKILKELSFCVIVNNIIQ